MKEGKSIIFFENGKGPAMQIRPYCISLLPKFYSMLYNIFIAVFILVKIGEKISDNFLKIVMLEMLNLKFVVGRPGDSPLSQTERL